MTDMSTLCWSTTRPARSGAWFRNRLYQLSQPTLRLGDKRAEADRVHELVRLALKRTQLRAHARVGQPFLVGPKHGALGFTVARALIDPDMYVFVRIAGFALEVAKRLSEAAELGRFTVLLIQLKVLGQGSGLTAIGADVEQHSNSFQIRSAGSDRV